MTTGRILYHTRPCLALALSIFQRMRCETATRFAGVGVHRVQPRPRKKKSKKPTQ